MKATNERVQSILDEVRGRHILHVGCVGEVPRSKVEEKHSMHLQLCRAFPQAETIGIDTNHAGLREMKQKGLNVLLGDAENLEFDALFDTIVAGELIEHLSNPGRFLEGCRKSLKPNGRVILSTPNPFSPMYSLMYLKNFTHAFNPEHALWLCPQTLNQIAERCGFRVTKILFVDDLQPEIVSSRWYRAFSWAWKLIRVLLPKRLRNTIVAVLEPNDFNPGNTQPLPAARR